MLRLLKKSGTLLITVPYGKYEEHGWLRNYDKHRWQELLGAARPRLRSVNSTSGSKPLQQG